MTTEEMEATEIPFQRYEDSKISLGNIIHTEKGTIADLNYDDIYILSLIHIYIKKTGVLVL